ncbi:MAG: hypothetical protein HY825_13640 [Acidobacteria bacterium]|nr:hypothetical protein [Acidobacteriota bacterium]
MTLDLTATNFVLGFVIALAGVVGLAWKAARHAARDEINSQDSDGYKAIVKIATEVAQHHRDTCPVEGKLIALIEGERTERREGRGEILEAISGMRTELLAGLAHLSARVDGLMNGRH